MTRPRSSLVSLADTQYYHCVGRCVRRAFLCGQDPVSGRSFDHRKRYILERLGALTEVFAIDLCAYALMSNHYHLVLRLAPDRAQRWSDREVVERWRRLYRGPAFVARFLDGLPLDAGDTTQLADCIARWRSRLCDLSWFMRCLNEYIARMANAEDGCTGRFWEGRFRSQALLDEAALLTVMSYVDLNPVRAGLAVSVEGSAFTSGQQRLREVVTPASVGTESRKPGLLPFAGAMGEGADNGLPFNLQDYLDLLDSTGRMVHPAKHGTIPASIPPLLTRLGLAPGEWLQSVTELHARFRLFVGSPRRLSNVAERRGWRWVVGRAAARRLYCRTLH
jgi:REP element-mobilizing transposase RayT